mmetsp:Transcript_3656/g.4628  ORF Transcript_3656/g.4628 Transcript_3656/m.4628 type:complete len:103 (+) Transcript_3656:12-320(+)
MKRRKCDRRKLESIIAFIIIQNIDHHIFAWCVHLWPRSPHVSLSSQQPQLRKLLKRQQQVHSTMLQSTAKVLIDDLTATQSGSSVPMTSLIKLPNNDNLSAQ